MNKLYGAILGDIVGKKYEYQFNGDIPAANNIEMHPEDSKISDDSILTLASARSILKLTNIEHEYKYWSNKYIKEGFGKGFTEWIKTPPGTIGNSWGNGSVMRISPFLWNEMALSMQDSVCVSHNNSNSLEAMRMLEVMYHGSCKESAIIPVKWDKFIVKSLPTIKFVRDVFYSTSSTKEAIQLAVSLGGDTDTTASIVGELSNYHRNDLTKEDVEFVESKLDDFQLQTLKQFNNE